MERGQALPACGRAGRCAERGDGNESAFHWPVFDDGGVVWVANGASAVWSRARRAGRGEFSASGLSFQNGSADLITQLGARLSEPERSDFSQHKKRVAPNKRKTTKSRPASFT